MKNKSIITRVLHLLSTMALVVLFSTIGIGVASAADMSNGADNFYKSDKVTMQKVTFKNQYKETQGRGDAGTVLLSNFGGCILNRVNGNNLQYKE
ncbi:hypothetical protein SCACP_25320 [Sporomusa carbonis]|uniref:hypothetical protein n=1 Tax=Sporomusa carbonis TaxID=3076075 RepID=UPI003A62600D